MRAGDSCSIGGLAAEAHPGTDRVQFNLNPA